MTVIPSTLTPIKDRPAFDSTRKALEFAFNADASFISPPTMNKMMAAVVDQGKPIKKAEEEAYWNGDEGTSQRRYTTVPQPGLLLKHYDRAAQAGFILQQVLRLDEVHQRILEARMTRYRDPCSCRSPCCSGFRYVPRWWRAVEQLCEILKERADILKTPGKRGLSTDPRLRWLIVETHFSPAKPPSYAEMGRRAEVDSVTVLRHYEWITSYLNEEEDKAWNEISAIFDQTGVTGLLE